jgi:hypothetical protein
VEANSPEARDRLQSELFDRLTNAGLTFSKAE